MKAIETQYAGCRFRSRLEARWAVFFDHLGVKWEYEPEGFDLDGVWYLPDFYLPDHGWVEVKPSEPHEVDPAGLKKWQRFCNAIAPCVECGEASQPDAPEVCGACVFDAEAKALFRIQTAYLFIGDIPDPRSDFSTFGDGYEDGIVWHGREGEDYGYCWCACPTGKHFGIEFNGRGARVSCHCPRPDNCHPDKMYCPDHPRILAAYTAARSARFDGR
jgi:hypothetical protein